MIRVWCLEANCGTRWASHWSPFKGSSLYLNWESKAISFWLWRFDGDLLSSWQANPLQPHKLGICYWKPSFRSWIVGVGEKVESHGKRAPGHVKWDLQFMGHPLVPSCGILHHSLLSCIAVLLPWSTLASVFPVFTTWVMSNGPSLFDNLEFDSVWSYPACLHVTFLSLFHL